MELGLVGDEVHFVAACPACGQEMQSSGGQTLVAGRLNWSIESICLFCGPTAVCGREDIPTDLRERIFSAHGPARLQISVQTSHSVAVMKVIRVELGLDLSETRDMLQVIRSGRHTGTMPEIEKFARSLRAAGLEARAIRP